jgi:phage-related protein
MATISDSLNMAAATAMKPFFDLAKEGLAGLAEWFNSPEIQAGITNLATKFSTLIQKVSQFVTQAVIPFVQNHGRQLITIIGAIVTGIGTFVVITSAIAKFVAFKAAIAAFGAAITAAGGGLGGLVALIGGPVTLVIAAIAAVVALFTVAWRNNWGDIQGKVAAVWAFLQPIFQAIIEWVEVKVKQGIEQLRAFWVDMAWPAIQRAIEVVWPIIQTIFNGIKDFIVNTLIPTLQSLWQKWTQDVWPVIQTVTENVWTIVKEIFTEIGNWVNDNLIPWIQELNRIWSEVVWPAIQAKLEEVWAIIEPIWEALRVWLADTLPPVINGLQSIFESVMSGIRAAIQPAIDLWNAFAGAVMDFWNWLSDKNFNFDIGSPNTTPSERSNGGPRSSIASPIGNTTSAGGTDSRSVVVNIDARGAGKGVDNDLRRMVEDVMRQYANKADVRMRTV